MADALLETAASQFVESYGSSALPVLLQRAEIAEKQGRKVAANIWRAIAAAAARHLADIDSRDGVKIATDTSDAKMPLPCCAGARSAGAARLRGGRPQSFGGTNM